MVRQILKSSTSLIVPRLYIYHHNGDFFYETGTHTFKHPGSYAKVEANPEVLLNKDVASSLST